MYARARGIKWILFSFCFRNSIRSKWNLPTARTEAVSKLFSYILFFISFHTPCLLFSYTYARCYTRDSSVYDCLLLEVRRREAAVVYHQWAECFFFFNFSFLFNSDSWECENIMRILDYERVRWQIIACPVWRIHSVLVWCIKCKIQKLNHWLTYTQK